ncbi:MAG: hypothetical protein KKD48_05425 [Nanoarchaeota archaeon]|nr:hypothetical protein [Nanoarchaeota archaeon]
MNIKFNLFLLNNPNWDKHPRSWICIHGKNTKTIISKIEKDIIQRRKINREQLSRLIAKNLKCNYVSIKNFLRGDTYFYPIPIILELCALSNKEKYYENILEKSIEYLKVNSASSKPIKAIKEVSENLAKIIGAFCADGSLSIQFIISSKEKKDLKRFKTFGRIKKSDSRKEYYFAISLNRKNYYHLLSFAKENKNFQTQTHYTIELTDEYKSNVESFNKWIFRLFKVNPNSFKQRNIAWRTSFSNKILARYLIHFFGFLPGYKTDIVSEPDLIKNSEFNIRKEFAKGAIMFDGCVTKRKTIAFSTISPALAGSIEEILIKDGLNVGKCINKRKEYTVYTFANEDIKKLLEYFEKGTKKWDLLRWLSDKNFESKQISYEKDFKTTRSIYELLKEMKIADVNTIKEKLNYNFITIRNNFIILRDKGKIRLSNKPKYINKFVSDRSTVFLKQEFHNKIFNELFKKFKTNINASNFLELNKATLSAWKVRKNRMPLYVLKNICNILNISQEQLYNQIEELDREIAEVI